MDVRPLDYARPRRRVPRWALLLAVATMAAWAAWHFAAPAWRHASLAYHVRQARRAFADCQQLALPQGVLYADRGRTPQLRPGDVTRFGIGGWRPPAPDVPPRVTKPPAVWLDLARHVRAAASLDRTSGTFSATAAAAAPHALIEDDEAVLFIGNPNGPPADPSGPHDLFTLTATPHELRWSRAAHQHLASKKQPGELSFNHPKERYFRIVVARNDAADRIEWFAARVESPGTLTVPYRLNGRPGVFTIKLGRYVDCELDATDGWVGGILPSPVWYAGSSDVALLRMAPAWKEADTRAPLRLRAIAFGGGDSERLVVVAGDWDRPGIVEAWRISIVGGDPSAALLSTVRVSEREGDRQVPCFISPNARRFAVSTFRGAHVYDVDTGQHLATCRPPPPDGEVYGMPQVGFSEDDGTLAMMANTRGATWWDIDTGRQIAALSADGTASLWGTGYAHIQHAGGRWFFLTSALLRHGRGPVAVADAPGKPLRPLTGFDARSRRAVSPSGRHMVTVGNVWRGDENDIGVTVYDLETGQVVLECREVGEACRGQPAWSGDGRRVAFCGRENVFVLDVPGRSLLRVRRPKLNELANPALLALSRDGRRLAGANRNSSIVRLVALPDIPAPPSPTTSSTRSPS